MAPETVPSPCGPRNIGHPTPASPTPFITDKQANNPNVFVFIFTLPRTYFYGVEVKQNELTTLKIPSPGRISFTRPQFGFGSIFIDRNTDLEFVAKLDEVGKGNDSFTLQPGKYVVIWRDKSFTDTEKSIYKNFEITSGCSKFIQLNK